MTPKIEKIKIKYLNFIIIIITDTFDTYFFVREKKKFKMN